MSGLHGDERSGPLAILNWLEETSIANPIPNQWQLWLAPLLNDLGWDRGIRLWNNLDLNRSFNSEAPNFLKPMMSDLAFPCPAIFLDLHEDSTKDYPYVFNYIDDCHGLAINLAQAIGARIETWTLLTEWEGTSESYLRRNGCNHCVTIEAPPIWSLRERLTWNKKAIFWSIEHLPDFIGA